MAASASAPVGNYGHVNVVVPEQLLNTELFGRIVFHDQQAFAPRRGVFFDPQQRRFQALGVVGLVQRRKLPRASP